MGAWSGLCRGLTASLAGATLVITDDLTHKERTVTANSEGSFIISNLDVGTYTVKVSASGFNTYIATNLKIDVGQEYTLNPKLTVGNVTAEVTVSAGADVLNASNAELSNTVTQEQIQTLPINGRNPLALIRCKRV